MAEVEEERFEPVESPDFKTKLDIVMRYARHATRHLSWPLVELETQAVSPRFLQQLLDSNEFSFPVWWEVKIIVRRLWNRTRLKYAASYRGLIYSATSILPYSSCIYIYLAD